MAAAAGNSEPVRVRYQFGISEGVRALVAAAAARSGAKSRTPAQAPAPLKGLQALARGMYEAPNTVDDIRANFIAEIAACAGVPPSVFRGDLAILQVQWPGCPVTLDDNAVRAAREESASPPCPMPTRGGRAGCHGGDRERVEGAAGRRWRRSHEGQAGHFHVRS